ncbi:hypothetical protein PR048_017833 [Dryococelus australis]|uniref:Uncharacterized protein n=1 Tax=Dryococelus australis TaxID=614101 RepID=A0ABQ9HAJ5_9NEOP|nr:hypothetical protein PR048_017833 [Dryococelus australis]
MCSDCELEKPNPGNCVLQNWPFPSGMWQRIHVDFVAEWPSTAAKHTSLCLHVMVCAHIWLVIMVHCSWLRRFKNFWQRTGCSPSLLPHIPNQMGRQKTALKYTSISYKWWYVVLPISHMLSLFCYQAFETQCTQLQGHSCQTDV